MQPLVAEVVKIAYCERDPSLDFWAAADNEFCKAVMHDVLTTAGIKHEHIEFGEDGLANLAEADVICSAFRTKKLLKDFDFPLQPLGRMHFALYATPSRAMELMSMKITEWPRMRIGYSPVSQGQISNDDRTRYFEHARLSPTYVEIPTSAGAVKALHDGEIDALFLYTPFGRRPEGVTEVVPIGQRSVYFAVSKKKPDLMKTLARAYRECYIDKIDKYDELREKLLGVPKPQKRVRVAAYSRGDLFEVTPDGDRSGALELWLKSIVGHTHWSVDYVITHECPRSRRPYAMYDWYREEFDPADELSVFLDEVDQRIDHQRLKRWYSGHYHSDRTLGDDQHVLLYRQIIPLGTLPA